MDINKLEVFVKVAETKSLTRASEVLGYTQSGVSHIIKSLEKECGFILFVRTTRKLQLTSYGQTLLPAAREILRWNEQFNQLVSSLKGMDGGVLRIASFVSIAMQWLPDILRALQADYPNIRIELMEGGARAVENWVREGAADLGFLSRQPHHKMAWIPLAEDELMAVLPLSHPLSGLPTCPVSALQVFSFINRASDIDDDIAQMLARCGIRHPVSHSSMGDNTVIAMVEKGLGISVLPALTLTGCTQQVRIRPLEPRVTRSLGILLPSLEEASPAAKKLIEYTLLFMEMLQGTEKCGG